jgi:outer membrane lipoprotein-sorting protein
MATSTGCLFRSRRVESHLSQAPLQFANAQELVKRVNTAAAAVQSMNATVDIATSVGGEKKGKVTEFSEIRGYILFERPAMLRMIGLMPVVRNRAFDMVSDGSTFKLWIPPKNRFITGPNEIGTPSPNPLENLRPQVIYDALLVREIDPVNEVAVLEAGMQDVTDAKDPKKKLMQGDYRLNIIRRANNGQWILSSKLFFNRADLMPYRQLVYDRMGFVATDVRYGEFREFNGQMFPAAMEIDRPQEEYTIGIKIVSLKLNTTLKPDQFELQQPAGAEVKVLGANGAAEATAGGSGR